MEYAGKQIDKWAPKRFAALELGQVLSREVARKHTSLAVETCS